MTTKLLGTRIWPRLTELAKASKHQCQVAVAYFGQGASKLLPLPKGSTVVVDLSERAVREGQTCPDELGNLIRRGVAVYSCTDLHAKLFVFGKHAVIGSANVSNRSKNVLIEAAIETTDPVVIRSCKQFVADQCLEPITEDDIERLAPLYKPPGGGSTKTTSIQGRRRLWAVGLESSKWDEEDNRQADKARPKATKELENELVYRLDEFCWTGDDLKVSEGDMVMQVFTESNRQVFMYPPSKVVWVQKFHVGRTARMIVFLRVPKSARRKRRKLVLKQLEAPSTHLRKLKRCRRIKNRKLSNELFRLWRVKFD